MAPRSGARPPRSKNALVIAASAITRSLESATPSRLSTLRLIADALRLFSNAAASAAPSNSAVVAAKAVHDPGSRALANAAVAVLLTLPSTGGTLHRRALALLHATAPTAGSATLLSATERARAHLKSLRPGSIADGDLAAEAAFSATAHALAYTSRCDWTGRAAAEESTRLLLAVRGPRAVRAAAAHAAGRILESFPVNFAPDPDIITAAAEAINAACITTSSASGKTPPRSGFALLAAALAPRLSSRPPVAEKLLRACVRALTNAPPAEKGAWAAAAARLAIVSRGARAKRASRGTLVGGKKVASPVTQSGPPLPEPQIFEGALITVARIARLSRAGTGCVLALATVMRAWALAIPEKVAVIPARAVGLLAAETTSVSAASVLRDAIVVGVVRDLEPSASYPAVERLQALFGTLGRVGDALVVDLCALIVRNFGGQAVLEVSDCNEGAVREGLLEIAHSALGTNFAAVRLSGVRLIAAVAAAVPRLHVAIFTAVLQGLRIADLALSDGHSDADDEDEVVRRPASVRRASRPNSVPSDLSAVLGNAVALAVLIEEAFGHENSNRRVSIPLLVLQQCAVSALKLFNPLRSGTKTVPYRDVVAAAVRRRAGWAIISGLARGRVLKESMDGGVAPLFLHWSKDLGPASHPSPDAVVGHNARQSDAEKDDAQVPVGVTDEVLAETGKRSAALAALAACLGHESTSELRKFARYIIGGCAARVALARNSPTDSSPLAPQSHNTSAGSEPMFYRASLNSTESLAATPDPDLENAPAPHSLLYLAEAVQVTRCVVLAPPVGALGEVCYYVAVALGEDAQRALGHITGVPSTGGVVAQFMSSFSKPPVEDVAIAHRRQSLSTLRSHIDAVEEDSSLTCEASIFDRKANDYGWICSTEGMEIPIAEEVISVCAEAISALVAECTSVFASGPVLESFCSSGLYSPVFSAVLALAVARRISSTDLAENGRVLAMLQVLVGRSLKANYMVQALQNTGSSEMRNASSEGSWNGTCINDSDLPGAFFREMANIGAGKPRASCMFPVQCPLRSVVFHGPATRSLGIIFATRTVTAEAYRVLASKGGSAMWLGLMKSVTGSLNEALSDRSPSHVNLAATCAAVLGVLLEIVPEELKVSNAAHCSSPTSLPPTVTSILKDTERVAKDAVTVLAKALDSKDCHVQAAAATALSENSREIASESERLMAALSRAWSMDNGLDNSPSQVFKCAEDALCWDSCLERICHRIVKLDPGNDRSAEPFLSPNAAGSSSLSPALGVGAASVLASSRKNLTEFAESAAVAGAELCTELLHWEGVSSLEAQAAGFRGLTEMWVARISSGRLQGTPVGAPRSPNGLKIERISKKANPTSYIPINFFSLRQAPQAGSSAGLYLEDVLYAALSSGRQGMKSGLQAAALRSVDLLLHEAGREAVCANFKRLPEILFGAVLNGVWECGRYLEFLANVNAAQRPKYWIGLCRAVGLGGKRLNTGTTNAVWDVNLDARHLALRVMRVAVTSSIAKCHCADLKGVDDVGAQVAHSCALGCLKEMLSALLSTLRISPVDVVSVEEVCGTLMVISSVFQDRERKKKAGSSAIAAIQELWVPIASSLGHFLGSTSSHRIIRSAAETSCQWLLTGCTISTVAIEEECVNLCRSLFGKEGLCFITRRFEHLERTELEGTDAVFSVLACVSQLFVNRSWVLLPSECHALDAEISLHLPILKNMLCSVCIDYVAMRSAEGRAALATNGGALSFAGVGEEQLQELYASHMPWIFAGVNALAGVDASDAVGGIAWCDEGSPGALRVRLGGKDVIGRTEELFFANFLLIMRDEKTQDKLFDPCRSFLRAAIHCARVMMHYLNVTGVPSIVNEAEIDMSPAHAASVRRIAVTSDEGPAVMEISSGDVESIEGTNENIEMAEVPLGNEQGIHEKREDDILSELMGSPGQNNTGKEGSGLVTNGLAPFEERPSKQLETPPPFEVSAPGKKGNEKQQAEGMHCAESPMGNGGQLAAAEVSKNTKQITCDKPSVDTLDGIHVVTSLD